MKIQELELRDFRNIEQLIVRPSPGINFFIGKNGQGKTSLLEAIDFLATLRSFRLSKPEEVIRTGSERSKIRCLVNAPDNARNELVVVFQSLEGKFSKLAYSQGKSYKSAASFLSQRFAPLSYRLHTVTFNPTDHDLIRGEPSQRRSYLDRALSAENPSYLKNLQIYLRNVTQRNVLLKNQPHNAQSLEVFTDQLCKIGSQIIHDRLTWLFKLNHKLENRVHKIAPQQNPVRANYLTAILESLMSENRELVPVHFSRQADIPSLQEIEYNYRLVARQSEKRDFFFGTTSFGPHREDWQIHGGEKPLKGHGSQGEIRTTLLGLRLSEIELFQEATGQSPLFLLDDFSSELDQERRTRLLDYLEEAKLQVFVTATEKLDIPMPHETYLLSQGRIDNYVD